MKDKATYFMGGIIILLLISVVSLLNADARKDGKIKLLEEKLSTSESVNDGLKDSVGKLIKYNECIAKIFIAPRSLDKAIAGNIDDPVAALDRCRIEVGGTPVSENPTPSSPAPKQTVTQTPSVPSSGGSGQGQDNQPASPPPQTPTPPPQIPPNPPPQSILPGDQPPVIACLPLVDICI